MKRNKDFLILYVGQAFSQLTSSVLQMAIVWYLISQSSSAVIVALSGIMAFLPQALLGMFVGVYIDRHNRKKIMIYSDLLIAMASLVLVIAGQMGHLSITLIMVVLALRSIGTAFHQPSLGAVTPLIVGKDELVKYNGYAQTLQSISLLISPALAAVLFAVWKLEYIVFLDVIGAVIAVLCILLIKIPNHKVDQTEEEGTYVSELKDGFKVLKQEKLLGFMLTGALFSVVYMPIFVLYPLITLDYFNKTEWAAGFVEIIFAVGMLIGAICLGKWAANFNKIKAVGIATFVMGCCLVVSGLLSVEWFMGFVICSFVLGFATPFYDGLRNTVFQERIADEYLGRVMALLTTVMVIGTPVGIAISGFVTDWMGVNLYFSVSGIGLIMIAGIYFGLFFRSKYKGESVKG